MRKPELLNELIDRIAKGENTHDVALSAGADELQALAAIHIATLLESKPKIRAGNQIQLGVASLRLVPSEDSGTQIRYNDVGVSFDLEKLEIPNQDGPKDLAALLHLVAYARDRSDILVYLPKDERENRIASLARSVGASERFVRFLVINIRSFLPEVAA